MSFYVYALSRRSRLFSIHLLFTRRTANLQVWGFRLSVLSLWILSVLRLIIIVSLIRTFMNISISDGNKDRNIFVVPLMPY